jgi:hypothetical protein
MYNTGFFISATEADEEFGPDSQCSVTDVADVVQLYKVSTKMLEFRFLRLWAEFFHQLPLLLLEPCNLKKKSHLNGEVWRF